MIDLKKYRENSEIYIKWSNNKWVNIDWHKFDQLDKILREIKWEIDNLNAQRNELSKEIETIKRHNWDAEQLMEKVKNIKFKIEEHETFHKKKTEEFNDIYLRIPNPSGDDVPVWKDDSQNVVIAYIWDKPIFDFSPLPHWELLEKRWMLDQERSSKVSWSRFYYIRDWVVRLELALVNWLIDKLNKKWFRPCMGPNMVKQEAMYATWFFPADKNEVYIVNPWEDDLYLIWTSEVTMVAQHMDEIIDVENLPIRYVWFSPCFRREAWSYGKDTKWMIRVHQFEKVEMVSFVKPEDSVKEHEFLLSIEEEIYQELWIPYQKLLICTGDLWAPASKKYDLEWWFPWQNCYKEITSTSNCTDFQARRWKIKYKSWKDKDFLHTLNGTAASMRALVAIIENYQTKDLRIKVPNVLKKYIEEDYL